MTKINLQRFADNPTNVRRYEPEFAELLRAVFTKKAYFRDFFGGTIATLDGITNNDKAFTVKTSDIPVAVGSAYNTGENVAFGTGTGSTNRFGNRTEVIYVNTDVPYSWEWTIHEGIDRHTVNNDMDAAIADRLELHAQARISQFNTHHGKFISNSAGKTISGGASVTKDNVADLFNALDKYFIDIEATGTRVVKCTADVYNAVVDSGLSTTSKNSAVDVDNNIIRTFKGFQIEEVPAAMFQKNEVMYAYIQNVGKAFTGIETTRTIEAQDFDGIAIQGAGKAGEYIPPVNKAAVAKVTVTGA